VTAGGLTDRYLADYPNMFGDLSAGSGLNALTRDEDFTRGFLERHQDKLLFGSDCSDPTAAARNARARRPSPPSAAWPAAGRSNASCCTETRRSCCGCVNIRRSGFPGTIRTE
jgi:hypothetical protein